MASSHRLEVLRVSDGRSIDSDAFGLQGISDRVRIPESYRRKRYTSPQKAKHNRKGKQLGRKLGYAAHIWMMKQKETHDKLVSSATSYVGNELKKHRKIFEHNKKVAALAARNRAAANKFAELNKKKNFEVEQRRLAAVQPHFRTRDFLRDYQHHAHKMQTMAMVDDQWMPDIQRQEMHKYRPPSHMSRGKRRRSKRHSPGGQSRRRSRPSTASSAGSRRRLGGQRSPASSQVRSPSGSRLIGLDEYLADGMSSILPEQRLSHAELVRPRAGAGGSTLAGMGFSSQSTLITTPAVHQ